MPTWLFILIVFGIGLLLAIYVDVHKSGSGSGFARGEAGDRRERFRWMYFWYRGRFPSRQELKEEGFEEEASTKEEEGQNKRP